MVRRKAILEVRHSNCGEMNSHNWWQDTYWTIYDDYTIRAKIEHFIHEEKNKSIEKKLTSEEHKRILNYIEHIKKEDEDIMALDGTEWALKQYSNGRLIYERKPEPIYDIKSFEILGYALYRIMGLFLLDDHTIYSPSPDYASYRASGSFLP